MIDTPERTILRIDISSSHAILSKCCPRWGFSFYDVQDRRMIPSRYFYIGFYHDLKIRRYLRKAAAPKSRESVRYRFDAVMIDYRKMFILGEHPTEAKLTKFTSRGDPSRVSRIVKKGERDSLLKTSSFRVEPSRLMGDLTPSISSSSMIPRRRRRCADLDFLGLSLSHGQMRSLARTHSHALARRYTRRDAAHTPPIACSIAARERQTGANRRWTRYALARARDAAVQSILSRARGGPRAVPPPCLYVGTGLRRATGRSVGRSLSSREG